MGGSVASHVARVECPNMEPRRVALVTGSGPRRIGWHVADALARPGYALALHYRTSAAAATAAVAELGSRGTEAIAVEAGLPDEPAGPTPVPRTLGPVRRFV